MLLMLQQHAAGRIRPGSGRYDGSHGFTKGTSMGACFSGVSVIGTGRGGQQLSNSYRFERSCGGFSGQPGAWQFTFVKDGYDSLSLSYDVTATGDGSVYLQKSHSYAYSCAFCG